MERVAAEDLAFDQFVGLLQRLVEVRNVRVSQVRREHLRHERSERSDPTVVGGPSPSSAL